MRWQVQDSKMIPSCTIDRSSRTGDLVTWPAPGCPRMVGNLASPPRPGGAQQGRQGQTQVCAPSQAGHPGQEEAHGQHRPQEPDSPQPHKPHLLTFNSLNFSPIFKILVPKHIYFPRPFFFIFWSTTWHVPTWPETCPKVRPWKKIKKIKKILLPGSIPLLFFIDHPYSVVKA